MTLEEAIKVMETIAEENQRVVDTGIVYDGVTIDMLYCDDTEVIEERLADFQKCADEHRQVAEWLKELKAYKEQKPCTNNDIQTMRILFNSDINILCNQKRWNDAKEMEEIRDRLMNTLKQEPILDKIRAEIKVMSGDIETIADVLSIIDKYKANREESEE